MASPPKETRKVLEGVFAINKPQWASSAGVLRDLQTHFQPSSVFTPWLDHERQHMTLSGSRKNKIDKLKVKLGHGGTLDPLATGVLIVGVGKGTKCLSRFLECTKSYETVVLFGAATDSYDAVGKVVSKAPYEHVTKELVEEKLAQFRGKIMQKPSVFSALKVDGKKMYEYAREGKEIPEVQARPVEVTELELVEWLEPGTHEYSWPKEEIEGEEKAGAEKLLGVRSQDRNKTNTHERRGTKRDRASADDELITDSDSHPKKPKTEDEPAMSGGLPVEESNPEPSLPTSAPENVETAPTNPIEAAQEPEQLPSTAAEPTTEPTTEPATEPATEPTQEQPSSSPQPQPPAARLRMTVTSGFYVRSLCHDLGIACSSLAHMTSLIRTRQGDYSLAAGNVLEYSELETPEVWEPKVKQYLEEFMEKEGWKAEEVEDEETWKKIMEERKSERREGDREGSWRGKRGGGGGGGGNWGKRRWNGNRR